MYRRLAPQALLKQQAQRTAAAAGASLAAAAPTPLPTETMPTDSGLVPMPPAGSEDSTHFAMLLSKGICLKKKHASEAKYQSPRFMWVDLELGTVHWAKGSCREGQVNKYLLLSEFLGVSTETPPDVSREFRRDPGFSSCCFSLLHSGGPRKTLDFLVSSLAERDLWVRAFKWHFKR